MYIYPYRMGSASAKALGQALDARRIRREGSAFKGNADKVVINWGNSELPPEVMKCQVINHPEKVGIASNKLKFFQSIEKFNNRHIDWDSGDDGTIIRIPAYTNDRGLAERWVKNGIMVVARQKLTGHSGEGIVMVETLDDMVDAPLYVQYLKKKNEYRVHVANGKAVDIQRKARRRDVADEDVNWRIRNHANGFVFARNENHVPPMGVARQAITTCRALGLDFGAVDIIYNERENVAYVLEVNTAPGLQGETLDGYVNRLRNWGKADEQRAEADERPVRVNHRVFLDDGLFAVEGGVRP